MKNVRNVFKNTRIITDNPLDFLQKNNQYIQNGHYVSLCYMNDVSISTNSRYINAENDKQLGDYINQNQGTRFAEDFGNVRTNDKYQQGLTGKTKTGKFVLDPMHIVSVGRYNFHWKDADRKRDYYEKNVLPLEHGVRKQHGFTEFEPENEFDDDDWHMKPKYGGPGIYPRVADRNENCGMGWEPINNEFYVHTETKNITFRQILRKSEDLGHKYYYVRESDGILEPLDTDIYNFLKTKFSRVTEKCDELVDEERAYIKDLQKVMSIYEHRNFNWEKILYMAVTAITKNENGEKEYQPFLWINTKVILNNYPWLDEDSLNDIVYENVTISKKELDEHFNNPAEWDANDKWNDTYIMDKIQESIMTGIDKALKKLLS